ncbi:hypothetical protein K490DRAFT_68971 [Saccharata proteae CBS 121410]|uniref:Uncharacterized protein n=1 Tax=Saccharata proteae CBS 121410 TaxID=1314787 RepID=A0A9P4HNT0_9PEZI|nr:hypothetical protein K490DRAFT_68971 [Saccharata proteae CBS 121410]
MRLLVQVLPPQQGGSHAPSSEAMQMNLPVKPTDTFADLLPLIKKRFASLFAEEMPVLNIKRLQDIHGSAIYLDEEVIQFFEDETDQKNKKIYVIQAQDQDPFAPVDAPRPHVTASKRSRAASSPEANNKRLRMESWSAVYSNGHAHPNAEVPASECDAVAGASEAGPANGQRDLLRADGHDEQNDSALVMVADSQRTTMPDGIAQLRDAAKLDWPEEASPLEPSVEPIGASRASPELPFGDAETTMANGHFLKPALPASRTAVGGIRRPSTSRIQDASPMRTTGTPDSVLQTTEPDEMTATQEEPQRLEGTSTEVRRRQRSVSKLASTPPSAQRPRESPAKPDEAHPTAPKPTLSPITSDRLDTAAHTRQPRRLSKDDAATADSDRVTTSQTGVVSASPKNEEAKAKSFTNIVSSSAAHATPRTAPRPHGTENVEAALERLNKLIDGRPTPPRTRSHQRWTEEERSIVKEARAANYSCEHIHERYLPNRSIDTIKSVAGIPVASTPVASTPGATGSTKCHKWSDEELALIRQEREKGVIWKRIHEEHFPQRSFGSMRSLQKRIGASSTPSSKTPTAGTQDSMESQTAAAKTPTKSADEQTRKREAQRAESERRVEECTRRQIKAKEFRATQEGIRQQFEAKEAREAKSKQEELRRSAEEQEETRRDRLAALQSSQASQAQNSADSLRRSVSFSDAVGYSDSPTMHRTTRSSAAPSTQKTVNTVTPEQERPTRTTRSRSSSSAPPPNKKSPQKPRQDSESEDDGSEYEESDSDESEDEYEGEVEREDGNRSVARYLSQSPSDASSSSSGSRSPGSSPPAMPERKVLSPYDSISPSAMRQTPLKGILKSGTERRSKSVTASQSKDAVAGAPKPAASSAKPQKPKSNDTPRQAPKPAAKPSELPKPKQNGTREKPAQESAAKHSELPKPKQNGTQEKPAQKQAAKSSEVAKPKQKGTQEKPAAQVPKRPGATTTGKRLPSLADIGKMDLTTAWVPPPDPLKGRNSSAPTHAANAKSDANGNGSDSSSSSESNSHSESSDSDESDDEETTEKQSKKSKKGGNRFKSLLKRMGPINPFQGLF